MCWKFATGVGVTKQKKSSKIGAGISLTRRNDSKLHNINGLAII